MIQSVETVIVGGGQAGLATSYFLTQINHEHIVLEQSTQPAKAWRDDRWDTFTLLTPNWSFCLPGAEYQGDEPDGFMPREEVITLFERYIDQFHLPVRFGVRVTAVEQATKDNRYLVSTETSTYEANNVVVATGLFQGPKIPLFHTELSRNILQLHSSRYRNPQTLPPGAVLVVGSAQSGCQIVEELYKSDREVYLSTGGAGRAPRRYRGRDSFEWQHLSGFLDRTVDLLPSPKAKFASNPQVSGGGGGHNLNLHQFARDGVNLLGRLIGGQGDRIQLAPDLHGNIAKGDQFEAELVRMIDSYIAEMGLDAPEDHLPDLHDGYAIEERTELDLQYAGITTIIWAMGYAFNFNLVKFPTFDGDGYPVQKRGVTAYPGLYFVGLPWLYKAKSGLIFGVGEDAEYIAAQITATLH